MNVRQSRNNKKLLTFPTSCSEYSRRWGIFPIQSPVVSFLLEKRLKSKKKTKKQQHIWSKNESCGTAGRFWMQMTAALVTNRLHCHLLWMHKCGSTIFQTKALLTYFLDTMIPQFAVFCVPVLGQSQRQWCSPPEIKRIPLYSQNQNIFDIFAWKMKLSL